MTSNKLLTSLINGSNYQTITAICSTNLLVDQWGTEEGN